MKHISKCERCDRSVECKILNDEQCHDSYVPAVKSPSAIEYAYLSPAGKSNSLKKSLAMQV